MEDRYVIHSYFMENGERKHSQTTLSLSEWEQLQEKHPLWSRFSGNMGIGGGDAGYFELTENQNIMTEYLKVYNFIDKYLTQYATKNKMNRDDIRYQFINYGKTQLVYVMTDANGNKQTILVKQPAVKYGAVKQEHDILCELLKIDRHVIAPIDYFADGEQELYVTPYLEQARCIASDSRWGVYIPEPIYRFEDFKQCDADVINSCMLAKLISYYDLKNGQGLASCKLGGGDFVLAKGYEKQPVTTDWIMQNLFLIAGREKIKCTFDEYLNIIKSEFSRRTIDDTNTPKLNVRARVPMKMSQIEQGIALGLELLKQRNDKLRIDEFNM